MLQLGNKSSHGPPLRGPVGILSDPPSSELRLHLDLFPEASQILGVLDLAVRLTSPRDIQPLRMESEPFAALGVSMGNHGKPRESGLGNTVDGRNPLRTAQATMRHHCLVVFTGKSTFQGFLGGAKWILSIRSISPVICIVPEVGPTQFADSFKNAVIIQNNQIDDAIKRTLNGLGCRTLCRKTAYLPPFA